MVKIKEQTEQKHQVLVEASNVLPFFFLFLRFEITEERGGISVLSTGRRMTCN